MSMTPGALSSQAGLMELLSGVDSWYRLLAQDLTQWYRYLAHAVSADPLAAACIVQPANSLRSAYLEKGVPYHGARALRVKTDDVPA